MSNSPMPSLGEVFKALLIIAGIVAIAAFGIGIVIKTAGESLVTFFQALGSLDTAIIVALVTGAVSVLTVIVGGIASNVQRENYYLRQHREVPYQKLIEMVYKMTAKARDDSAYTQDELMRDFNEFSQALTLWGSPKAIKLWTSWRLASTRGKQSLNPRELLFAVEEVMLQLRRDMGQKRGLKKGDLLKLFINDVDEKLL